MNFIDICAGIGGFRSGLELAGHKCIGYVEIDKYARKSYEAIYDTQDEWMATDITKVKAEEIPKADLWCFGFPCQDISVAGSQKGLTGERSGIFYSIVKLLKSKNPEDRPKWLLIENVKNLLSLHGGWEFTEVLYEISEAGYDAEWHLINSKDHGVPQNRERVFIIGCLRGKSGKQLLPISETDRQINRKGQIEQTKKIEKILKSTQHFTVIKPEGISPTVAACDYKDPQKMIVPKQIVAGSQAHRVYNSDGLSVTIKAEGGGVGAKTGLYAVPCLTPNRLNKRQNGRRFKDNEDPMFTLTAQDRHGVLIYNGEEYYIRRLTPKECFRLQGFTDEQFDKAESVNSNTQLYKQAGNAVTVNVAYELGLFLNELNRQLDEQND